MTGVLGQKRSQPPNQNISHVQITHPELNWCGFKKTDNWCPFKSEKVIFPGFWISPRDQHWGPSVSICAAKKLVLGKGAWEQKAAIGWLDSYKTAPLPSYCDVAKSRQDFRLRNLTWQYCWLSFVRYSNCSSYSGFQVSAGTGAKEEQTLLRRHKRWHCQWQLSAHKVLLCVFLTTSIKNNSNTFDTRDDTVHVKCCCRLRRSVRIAWRVTEMPRSWFISGFVSLQQSSQLSSFAPRLPVVRLLTNECDVSRVWY